MDSINVKAKNMDVGPISVAYQLYVPVIYQPSNMQNKVAVTHLKEFSELQTHESNQVPGVYTQAVLQTLSIRMSKTELILPHSLLFVLCTFIC